MSGTMKSLAVCRHTYTPLSNRISGSSPILQALAGNISIEVYKPMIYGL